MCVMSVCIVTCIGRGACGGLSVHIYTHTCGNTKMAMGVPLDPCPLYLLRQVLFQLGALTQLVQMVSAHWPPIVSPSPGL